MPREQIRKRGKRKNKNAEEPGQPSVTAAESSSAVQNHTEEGSYTEAGPSSAPSAASAGIHPSRLALLKGGPRGVSASSYIAPVATAPANGAPVEAGSAVGAVPEGEEGAAQWVRGPRTDSEFPFGVLDPDLKGYFKTVEEQIKDWEGSSSIGEEREDRQNFLTSVLGELRTHELTVATDPECSVVLERLLPSMGDWGRRVLGDTFSGSWETLMRHRFGSHVVQSWIRLGADTIEREARGEYPPQQPSNPSEGSLRSTSELFLALIDSLIPTLPTLLTHQYASPPIRLLLLVLSPNKALPDLSGEGGDGAGVRSKRSGKFRKGQAVKGTSIVDDPAIGKDKGKGKAKGEGRGLTQELVGSRRGIREGLMSVVQANEWRVMGVDVVGSAFVQLLLDCEVEDSASLQPSSLLDHLTEGLVTELDAKPLAKQYIPSLLVSQAGTHMLESILALAPQPVFDALWELYFVGKLGRLAGHPMGNYVVAKGVGRLGVEQVQAAVGEVQGNAGGRGLIKSGRTSVLLALIERATVLQDAQGAVMSILYTSLQIIPAEASFLVPCLMTLKTYPIYQALLAGEDVKDDDPSAQGDNKDDINVDRAAEDQAAAAAKYAAWQNRRNPKAPTTGLEPALQGSLLLQALVKMGWEEVFESLFAQPQTTLMAYATNPIASRFLDAVLTAPIETVAPKWRKKLMMAFMGSYRELVQDRIGSRVGDTIWDVADGFMKIARSLAPHATALSNSQFGRFYANKLKLHLLQRRPEEWKQEVINVRHHFAHQKDAVAAPVAVVASGDAAEQAEEVQGKNEKRAREKDEIDTLFAGTEKKRKKSKVKV